MRRSTTDKATSYNTAPRDSGTQQSEEREEDRAYRPRGRNAGVRGSRQTPSNG